MEGVRATVVVADDEEALRLLCRINLEAEGYRVLEAKSAAELREAIRSDDVAAVLLDIHLGADDGVELARRLRAEEPGLALVFFTGSALPLEPAVKALVDGVLAKPFSPERLCETVRRVAPRSRS